MKLQILYFNLPTQISVCKLLFCGFLVTRSHKEKEKLKWIHNKKKKKMDTKKEIQIPIFD